MNRPSEESLRVSFEQLASLLDRGLRANGFDDAAATRCAYIFAENSLVGVASHGLNRFPRFVEWIRNGWVRPAAVPTKVDALGSVERWDGRLGPGPLNAERAMERAMSLAATAGVGVVALRNTNHWMRAGTYATQAANAGQIGICFTNTEPNLPPWGGAEPKLGNNPVAIGIPRHSGRHVLFDGALSQFSYGALETAARTGSRLPVPGGFTGEGELTNEPAKILESMRPLPIGYWKGAGLSLVLDLVGAILAGGRTTRVLGTQDAEYGVTQVFVALAQGFLDVGATQSVESTLADLHSTRRGSGTAVTYPGERLWQRREENITRGVPVDPEIWQDVQRLVNG